MLANASTRVDEVERRPVLILEGPPDRIIVVDHDRIVDLHLLQRRDERCRCSSRMRTRGCARRSRRALAGTSAPRRGRYGSVRSQLMQRVGAEVDEHDLAGEARRRQPRRIEPLGRAAECRQLSATLPSRASSCAEHAEVRGGERHRRPPRKPPSTLIDALVHHVPDHASRSDGHEARRATPDPSDEGIDHPFDHSARSGAGPIPRSDGRLRVGRASFVARPPAMVCHGGTERCPRSLTSCVSVVASPEKRSRRAFRTAG